MSFTELINAEPGWDLVFATQICPTIPNGIGPLFHDLLNSTDAGRRVKLWGQIVQTLPADTQARTILTGKLSHPYYVGIGNFKADVLIIGNELAFDPNRTDKLFHESVNTVFNWKAFLSRFPEFPQAVPTEAQLIQFKRDFGFCPAHPFCDGYYANETTLFGGGHTFKKYAKLCEAIFNTAPNYFYFNRENITNIEWQRAFFSRIYGMESNHVPALTLAGVAGDTLDLPLFREFINGFKVIIVPKNVLAADVICERFQVHLAGELQMRGSHTIEIYIRPGLVVIAANQLSNSAWRNEELLRVGTVTGNYLRGNITEEGFFEALSNG